MTVNSHPEVVCLAELRLLVVEVSQGIIFVVGLARTALTRGLGIS